MVDEFNRVDDHDDVELKNYDDPHVDTPVDQDYKEETATEFAAPINTTGRPDNAFKREDAVTGNGIGWLSLALSIISLFIWPVILGAAGIIVGFIARKRGAKALGAWAIGIGIASIIIGIFIVPFF
jgi:hypothetical protein